MRISGEQSQLAGRVGAVSGVSSPSSAANESNTVAGVESSAATLSLSPAAQEISRAKQAVNASPDVREDLVASIKAKVDSGTYNVSGSDIAEMMLRRHAADHSG